jgi:hypothetical protein
VFLACTFAAGCSLGPGSAAQGIDDTMQGIDYGTSNRVYASFDLGGPEGGPFPTDIFTVEDPTQYTGRRVNYPLPNCSGHPTDCDDLAQVNLLDGWGLAPRISVPFTQEVDTDTLNADTVFLLGIPGGERIGINQMVWDPVKHTLHAEADAVLEQHHRYALIVTDGVRDTSGSPAGGKAVKATSDFESMDAHRVPEWYQARIREALEVAAARGILTSHIVAASAFTTQSVTPVMERIRDAIIASTPEPADFNLGPNGERTAFAKSRVASVASIRHLALTSPPGFSIPQTVNLTPLNDVAGAVGTIAYGRYSSPDYMVHPDQYIPAVGTLGTPPVQATGTIYFTLYLPAGDKPREGWPIAIMAGGSATNKHFTSTFFAARLAQRGIAAIGINYVGQGFGPLSRLLISKTDGTSMEIPDAGRCVDQNNDLTIGAVEGSRAGGTRSWTIAERDVFRQTVIDFIELVRVIEVGMDVDGDGSSDIDPSRIYFVGASQGSMLATVFLALEPDVHAGVGAFVTGVIPEHLRWQVVRRGDVATALRGRTPSLLNDNGVTSIEDVAVTGPFFFNENKPLRDKPLVTNDVPGALEIQAALEFSEMVSEAGLSPALWSRYLRLAPLTSAKSVMYLNAKGDRSSVNPGTTLLLRAGDLADRTIFFRTDLVVQQHPALKEPHGFIVSTQSPDLFVRQIAGSAQDSIAAFLQSDGAMPSQPMPVELFEMPIVGPLPETLNYMP